MDDALESHVERDHESLARLIERAGRLCGNPAGHENPCRECPQEKVAACHEALLDLGDALMALMIAHIHREHDLMNVLPPTRAVRTHCEKHRDAHAGFSTRFNRVVSSLDASLPCLGARSIESLVVEWVRRHALEFDAELVTLARNHRLN
jgi:hemerythrin